MDEQRRSSQGGNGVSTNGVARRLSVGEPSRRMVGLPLARFIPQDIHTVGDYLRGAAGPVLAAFADETSAKIACATIGAAGLGVSLLTDYRLSLAKWIPIEVHEMFDHAWGIANIAAPFVFGYRKKDPVVSLIQMATGVGVILGSLLTDYRSYRRPTRRAR